MSHISARGVAMSNQAPVSPLEPPTQMRGLYGLYNNRSVRTKLILAFLAVTLLAVVGVALLSSRATQDALTQQVGINLHSLSESRAHALGDLIDRQADLLEAFALSKLIQDGAVKASTSYSGDP